jgi:large subunit ribosomal protein L24
MQRVFRGAAAARKQALKKLDKSKKQRDSDEIRQLRKDDREWKQRNDLLYRNAMNEMKEDWALGPLAPRRESGVDAKRYGYADYMFMNPRKVLPQIHKSLEAERKHGYLRSRFVAGDRVVVMRGMEAGRIGVIDTIVYDDWSVKIRGIRQVRLCFILNTCMETLL